VTLTLVVVDRDLHLRRIPHEAELHISGARGILEA
jgi:hypothetical protein